MILNNIAVNRLYTLLFAISIILINPWGLSRGEIWTKPKVLAVLLICLVNISILWLERKSLNPLRSWKISNLLWQLFLGIGLLSSLQSLFPLLSFWGQDQIGDGWIYWLIIATFNLSNTLVLKIHPEFLRSQLNGLLIGGVILAISMFPQLLDWRIDYTITTGKLLGYNVLVSTIFQQQQPIGLYSHRGHAAFVLTTVALLALVSWKWKWIDTRLTIFLLALIIPVLLLTFTRAAILSLMVAGGYWLYFASKVKLNRKVVVVCVLVTVLFVGAVSSTRKIETLRQFNFDTNTLAIKYLTSDRWGLWEQSLRAIIQKPLLGWGFDGFGISYPYVHNPNWKPNVVSLGDLSFSYKGKNGDIFTKLVPTYKAHNLILDTTVSVGFLGMLCYGALLGFCLVQVVKSPYRGIEAVAVAYLAFTFTWFECAQFTHLVWWVLSLWGVNHQRLIDDEGARPL